MRKSARSAHAGGMRQGIEDAQVAGVNGIIVMTILRCLYKRRSGSFLPARAIPMKNAIGICARRIAQWSKNLRAKHDAIMACTLQAI